MNLLAAKARGTHLRIHFKHCREIGKAIQGRTVGKAKAYLEDVLQFKEAIPFTKYTGGIGRHAIGKKYKAPGDKVGWPLKATRTFIDLLRNIESNAEVLCLTIILMGPCINNEQYRLRAWILRRLSSPT